jgi:hypothetical protein
MLRIISQLTNLTLDVISVNIVVIEEWGIEEKRKKEKRGRD